VEREGGHKNVEEGEGGLMEREWRGGGRKDRERDGGSSQGWERGESVRKSEGEVWRGTRGVSRRIQGKVQRKGKGRYG